MFGKKEDLIEIIQAMLKITSKFL